MATTIGEDLRTFLLEDSSISTAVGGSRCYQNEAVENYAGTFIWYSRSDTEPLQTLDEAAGVRPWSEFIDLECISDSIDAAIDLGDLIRTKHATRGTFGAGTVSGLFIGSQSDNYLPRGDASDDGLNICAFNLEIIGYKPGA